jgi:hypothetical protein
MRGFFTQDEMKKRNPNNAILFVRFVVIFLWIYGASLGFRGAPKVLPHLTSALIFTGSKFFLPSIFSMSDRAAR